jgi:hypothetical protein
MPLLISQLLTALAVFTRKVSEELSMDTATILKPTNPTKPPD